MWKQQCKWYYNKPRIFWGCRPFFGMHIWQLGTSLIPWFLIYIYLRVASKMLNHKGTSDHKETQLSRSNHMSVRTEATVYHSAANTVTDWGPNQGQALNSPPHVGFCILWQRYQCERDTFLNFSCDYEIQSWTSVQNYSTDKPCHRWAPFTMFQHCILCHAAWLQHPPSPLFMRGWCLLLLWGLRVQRRLPQTIVYSISAVSILLITWPIPRPECHTGIPLLTISSFTSVVILAVPHDLSNTQSWWHQ